MEEPTSAELEGFLDYLREASECGDLMVTCHKEKDRQFLHRLEMDADDVINICGRLSSGHFKARRTYDDEAAGSGHPPLY